VSAVVVDAMPSVVVEANNYASFIDHSLIVVTEGEEHESFLVSIVVFVDTGYVRIWFIAKDRLFVEV
jgi:hypothetical protein